MKKHISMILVVVMALSYLAIGGESAVAGAIPNDFCEDAISVGVPSTTAGTTTNATVDSSAPSCGDAGTPSAGGGWYTVIGTGNMMTATTCDYPTPGITNYDTKLSVYCSDCNALTCIDGNDDDESNDACYIPIEDSNYGSSVTWCSQAGATYLILVHGYNSNTGDFDLSISDDGAACTGAVECPVTTTTGCDQYSGTTKKLCTKYCEKLQCDEDIPRHDLLRRWLCKYYGYKFERRTGTEPPCDGLM